MSYTQTLHGSYSQFDPDVLPGAAMALRVDLSTVEDEQPVHQHRRAQLVISLRGSVTCHVADALLMVLPDSGVWIPGDVPHSNKASQDSQILMLFVEQSATSLPMHACILGITALVREMVIHLADQGERFPDEAAYARYCAVMLDQLSRAPVEQLSVPLTRHPKLRPVCNALIAQPGDRRSRADWAREAAMSERTFDRLVMKETGLSFGRWRQQLQLIVALRDLSAGVSVQRVALTLGYESTTAFIIMFKKAFGVPPGRYIVDHRAHAKPALEPPVAA